MRITDAATELPVDELPNGLPLFNVFLHLPAYSAQIQLFRLIRSYVVDRFTLHTLLVHPQEQDAVPDLATALGFCQLHGEVWLFHRTDSALTLGRAGQPASPLINADRGRVSLVDSRGRVLAEEEDDGDDATRVRLLGACFRREYADEALSVPFVRAYPGRTSLITRCRPFPQLFTTDPVSPRTDVVPAWPGDRRRA